MARNTITQDEKVTLSKKSTIIKRLASYIRPYWKTVIVIMMLMIFTMVVGLINPVFVKYTVDVAIANNDTSSLIKLAAGIAGLNLLAALAAYHRLLSMGRVSNKIILNMREELYCHIQKLSFAFFDSRPVGKILARVVGDINS